MRNFQTVRLCALLKLLVEVGVAPRTILHPVHEVVQVAHLVQQRGGGFFNRTVKRRCAYVNFMPLCAPRAPRLAASDMPIRARRIL